MSSSSRSRTAGTPARTSTLGAVTPADFEKLAQLRRMKAIALGLLLAMAVVFVISYGLQDRVPALAYVRAASEGGMVGAIADWFAVTALFRYPLGLKIPHTNIIAARKDEIGEGLGSFIDDNFLSDEVITEKLRSISLSRAAGTWLAEPGNSERLAGMAANLGLGALTVLEDSDVRDLIEDLARRHLVEPEWSPTISRAAGSFLEGGHHHQLIDLAAERLEGWLVANPRAFDRIVSGRLPSWVPSAVNRMVDGRAHAEVVSFMRAVRENPEHPFRLAADRFLRDLARDLGEKPELRAQVERLKGEVFDSPRLRRLAEGTWASAKAALTEMLQDPSSELRAGIARATSDLGARLLGGPELRAKIDEWVLGLARGLVSTHRHDIAHVVVETVQRWDAREAAEKIELQVGKDLQFIRINGTVVGALAGLAIFTIAHNLIAPLFG